MNIVETQCLHLVPELFKTRRKQRDASIASLHTNNVTRYLSLVTNYINPFQTNRLTQMNLFSGIIQ